MSTQAVKDLLNEMFQEEMYQEYLDCIGTFLAMGGELN